MIKFKKPDKSKRWIIKSFLPLLLVAFAGLTIIGLSVAQTPISSIETESGSVSSQADTINDTSASGSKAVKFGAGQSLPLLGAATYNTTSGYELDWDDFESQMQGDVKARRSYELSTTIPSSFSASKAAQDVANGDVSFWSIKLDPGAFSSGSMDTAFNNFLASIPAGHQTYITYFHEPEDNIANHTVVGNTALTLANWQASVNHMGQLIHATGRPELHNMIILMGPWTFYSGGYGGTEYWGSGFDQSVDAVGMDIYANGVKGDGFTNYAAIPDKSGYSQMMSWLDTHIISKGKRWGITEIGAHEEHPSDATSTQIAQEDQDKADWIADSWAWAKSNNALCYIYFNYNATSGLPDNQSNIILPGSPSETTFRSMVAEANN